MARPSANSIQGGEHFVDGFARFAYSFDHVIHMDSLIATKRQSPITDQLTRTDSLAHVAIGYLSRMLEPDDLDTASSVAIDCDHA